MARWVTSKGRRIYIPDEGEENPYAKKERPLSSKNDYNAVIRDAKSKEELMKISKEIGNNSNLSPETRDKLMGSMHEKAQSLKDQINKDLDTKAIVNKNEELKEKQIADNAKKIQELNDLIKRGRELEIDVTPLMNRRKALEREQKNKKQVDKLNSKNKKEFIISKNSDGQELRIPRKTYEQRLKDAEEYKQGLYKMANNSKSGYKLSPTDIRKADEKIKELKAILDAGTTEYKKKKK